MSDVTVMKTLDRHQRHIENSPGAGESEQRYALATIEDIRSDLLRDEKAEGDVGEQVAWTFSRDDFKKLAFDLRQIASSGIMANEKPLTVEFARMVRRVCTTAAHMLDDAHDNHLAPRPDPEALRLLALATDLLRDAQRAGRIGDWPEIVQFETYIANPQEKGRD